MNHLLGPNNIHSLLMSQVQRGCQGRRCLGRSYLAIFLEAPCHSVELVKSSHLRREPGKLGWEMRVECVWPAITNTHVRGSIPQQSLCRLSEYPLWRLVQKAVIGLSSFPHLSYLCFHRKLTSSRAWHVLLFLSPLIFCLTQ